MFRFGRNRKASIDRIKIWAAGLKNSALESLSDWQRLRDWQEAVRYAQDGLEKLGFEGFVTLGAGDIVFHPATGTLYLDTGARKTETPPHVAFSYFGGCQPTIDALADALDALTTELQPEVAHS